MAGSAPHRRRVFPFRVHLLVLLVGTLLPALAVAALLVRHSVHENRDAVRRQLLEAARAEAAVVDAELLATIRSLRALSESDHLTTHDLARFADQARRVQAGQPGWLVVQLHTPDGQPHVNTGRAPGEELPAVLDRDSFQAIVMTRRAQIGNLRARSDKALAFAVRVPVVRGDQLLYVLSAVMNPAWLADLLRGNTALSDEWVRGIVDGSGLVVARTREPERFVGRPGTPSFLQRVRVAREDVYEDVALDGQRVYGAFAKAPVSGWVAGVAVPAPILDAAFRRSMVLLGIVGLILLAAGSGAAFLVAHRVSQDLQKAATAADALAGGQAPEIPQSSVAEIARLGVALARSSALLQARQRERDEHLARAEAARAEAEAADHAKDNFLAMLGHELRNPLAPVLTAIELMRKRGEVSTRRERDIIERQASHLVRLVDDLLDVSRVRRGRIDLRQQRFELSHAIEKAVEIAQPRIQQSDHQLTVDVPSRGLEVNGDETRLAQVFANILTNAAKYTAEQGRISLHAWAEGHEAVVECSDNGIGMDEQLLPHVFDLFAQGEQSRERHDGGLGLGLALARTLVELHGGTITARSDGPGQGSTFTVRLPLVMVPVDVA